MEVNGREVKFTLNTSLDEIKVKWLKERTVSVIFKENARFLSKKIKDDIIRAFVDGWILGSERFPRETRRGRVKIEGPNALSYVAKSREVANFMISEGGVEIPTRQANVSYEVQFKPWMTRAEFRDLRRQEDDRIFWVIAVQVPLDDMSFIYAQIEIAIGKIEWAHPPDVDPDRPALVNARFDLASDARGNMKGKMRIITSKGDDLEVCLACSTTPKCRTCQQFFHTEEECRRRGGQNREVPGGTNIPTQQPSQAQSSTGQGTSRRLRYHGPLGPQPQAEAAAPAGFAYAADNPMFSPGGILQASPSVQNLYQMMWALQGAASQGGIAVNGGCWRNPRQQANQFHVGMPPQYGGGFHQGLGGQGISSAFQSYQPNFIPQDQGPSPHGLEGGIGVDPRGAGTSRQQKRSGQPSEASLQPGRGSQTGGRELGAEQEGSASRTVADLQQRSRPAGKQRRLNMSSVKELHTEASGESFVHSTGQQATSGAPGQKTTRDRRLATMARGQGPGLEQLLIPLACTTVRNGLWVITWHTALCPYTLPSQQVDDAPTPWTILQTVETLFLRYFSVRLIGDCPMARIITKIEEKRIKLFVPLVDATMTTDDAGRLESLGMKLVPLTWFAEGRKPKLGRITITPKLSAECLSELKIRLHKDKRLDSQFVRDALTQPLALSSQATEARGTGQDSRNTSRIQRSGGGQMDG
ncbi:hypothetical protein CBR_g6292 [Chara braunii]|uniref:Uncharacterized protein n=1 Tax=Chara braunii TaxID=69332 RepID=A0A388KJC8_CHABU|nr:hypothetical protein CBR_g6292 [Chara braunii]|eukprot:GBG70161.1 hypothetical protein CBR_g6292 [Chara braunii]